MGSESGGGGGDGAELGSSHWSSFCAIFGTLFSILI